jgi:hypothetical protein
MLRDARPLRGVQNVLKACREEFDLIAADGRSLVAVIDEDKIRQELKLFRDTPIARVEQEIRRGCPAPGRLFVALLHQNTESVIEAIAACDPGLSAKRVEQALRKDRLERDAILVDASRERARPLRDCVLGRMPSFRNLVAILAGLLGAPLPDAPAVAADASRKPRRKGRG